MPSKYVRVHDDEWTGLYIDGVLDTYGDSYVVDDRIAELLGVVEWYDVTWIHNDGHTPYATTDDIQRRADEEAARFDEAERLRHEAEKLFERARELEGL